MFNKARVEGLAEGRNPWYQLPAKKENLLDLSVIQVCLFWPKSEPISNFIPAGILEKLAN